MIFLNQNESIFWRNGEERWVYNSKKFAYQFKASGLLSCLIFVSKWAAYKKTCTTEYKTMSRLTNQIKSN